MTCWTRAGNDLLVNIRLTPNATRDAIGGTWRDDKGRDWMTARVRAVPEKGRANTAIMTLLAQRLDWTKSAISLESGDTNRLKRLRVIGGAQDLDRITALLTTWTDAL